MSQKPEVSFGPGVWAVDVQEHEGTVLLRFSFANEVMDCVDSYLMPIDIVPMLCNELIDLWLTHSDPKPADCDIFDLLGSLDVLFRGDQRWERGD